MCEMQGIILASTKVAIYSKKKPGCQQLCCGLNLSYLSNSVTVICVEGSDDVLSTLCSSCKWVGSGGHFASDLTTMTTSQWSSWAETCQKLIKGLLSSISIVCSFLFVLVGKNDSDIMQHYKIKTRSARNVIRFCGLDSSGLG